MGRLLRRAAWVAAMMLALIVPREVRADARTQARKAFEEGLRQIERGAFDQAITSFERANEILPHPDVQYNLAYACIDAGRYREAIRWFEIYLGQPVRPPDAGEVEAVVEKLRELVFTPQTGVRESRASLPEGEAPALDQDTAVTDLRRIEEIARLLEPLAPERARELETISRRLRLPLASRPAPPMPEAEPVERVEPEPAAEPITAPVRPAAPRVVEEYQEQELVTAATRRAATPQEAPGVVWVITQQEIRERGYESVAEALKSVAGLHVIDDHVFVDVGVRGLHAGLRGQSRIIKVLIDGHPVSFRPTSGNFLGLELIPIRAVDRIELVRGPASALYGANAFLGVLQIVTRRGGDVRGGSFTARGGLSSGTEDALGGSAVHPSASADLIVGAKAGELSLLLAAQAAALDRSGMRLPETSPLAVPLSASRGGISQDDTAAPISLFASLAYALHDGGRLDFSAGYQRLHARAEWLDYGALTHFSRIVLDNTWARLSYDRAISRVTGLSAFVSYSEGGPGEGHRLRILRTGAADADPSRHLVETYDSRALFTGFELRWEGLEGWSVRGGADFDLDHQRLISVDTVFDRAVGARRSGDSIPAPASEQGDQTFQNLGAYLQLSVRPLEWIDGIAGIRFDHHNLYQSSINGRVGTVFRLSELFYVKVLYGSSFRAPAADQLFRGAAYLGDAIGCTNYAPCASVGLEPQTAHTGEVVLGMRAGDRIEAQLTGYVSFVDELIISFPNVGGFFVTTNAGSYLSRGLELDASLRTELGALLIRPQVFFSLSRTGAEIPASQFEPAEAIRDEFREASLFPGISGGAGLDLAYSPAKLGLYLEGRYVGARRASGSNLTLGAYEDDALPGFFELDLNLSTRDLVILGEHETTISLRVTNTFDTRYAEGGFRGWDVPGRGRLIFLRVIQEF